MLKNLWWISVLSVCVGMGASHASQPSIVINPSGLTPTDIQMVLDGINPVVRLAEDQDSSESLRLQTKGRDAIVSALATQGYFDPKVSLEIGEDFEGETWDIAVKLGQRSVVRNSDQNFIGVVTTRPFANTLNYVRSNWPLKEGDVFLNDKWGDAKSYVLESIQDHTFYLARMVQSQAIVHVADSAVDTSVTVDSGPRVGYGEVEVIGLRRVPASIISRYVRYDLGQVYRQEDLEK